MSEKFRFDRKIGFQNTFYTKYINVIIIIDNIGPSIILRSIFCSQRTLGCKVITNSMLKSSLFVLFCKADANYHQRATFIL